jgi:TPR repeat protein
VAKDVVIAYIWGNLAAVLDGEGSGTLLQLLEKEMTGEQIAEAQFCLGACYEWGNCVAKDSAEAVKWYRKAAEQGDAEAQFHLGFCYYKGDGVAKDAPEAVKWFSKAAEQGLAEAQNSLGACYSLGHGVTYNDVNALMWVNLAAASGDEEVKKFREHLEGKMAAEQIAEAQRLSKEWKPRPHQGE